MTLDDAARARLDWVVAALRGTLPTEAEVADALTASFLAAVPASRIVDVLRDLADDRLEVTGIEVGEPGRLVASTSALFVIQLAVEQEAPYRVQGLRFAPAAEAATAVEDPRLADPPVAVSGGAPDALVAGLRERFGADGLVGLLAMGFTAGGGPVPDAPAEAVSVAVGWADLASGEPCTTTTRSAAYSVTKLVTTVAVLRLVAADRLALDAPVNSVLTSYRLSSDDVTVRDLLTHTGGVSSDFEHWVDEVPDVAELLGPVLEVHDDRRGRHVYSNGGFATLGAVVADVSGRPYEVFVAEEVLRPLGMLASDFPRTPPWPAAGVASGYEAEGGRIVDGPRKVPSVPAAGGLWTTAADLARFAVGWPTLLPPALVGEALAPHAEREGGGWIGLGFLLGGEGDDLVWGHAGGGVGFGSSVLCRPAAGHVAVAFVNRSLPAEPYAGRVLEVFPDVG